MKDPETFVNTIMSPIAYYKSPKTYFSGGAGLTSTAGDYARFCQMLLNGGDLDGTRLLSPKTVELMTTSHTSDLPTGGGGAGSNFGLGFRITNDLGATQTLGSAGMYGWGGAFCTYFQVDPKEELIGVMMTQVRPYNHINIRQEFMALANQAIVDSAKPGAMTPARAAMR